MGGQNFIDLTGKQFGRWTVIERAPNSGRGKTNWWCECLCEKRTKRIISTTNLKSGASKSCGCLRKEVTTERNHNTVKRNTYILHGDFGEGASKQGNKFYFDLEDYDRIKDYYWRENKDGYLKAWDSEKQGFVSIHQIILLDKSMDFSNFIIDHINRDTLDNRKSNLRIVTLSQNRQNHGIQKNNTSGFSGVSWNTRQNKWHSQIFNDKKVISLGYYTNKEEAIKARLKAELKYYGADFAPQRHLFKEYGVSVDE